MLPNHFVILWNDQPVGLDRDSGGYPYKTDWPGNVKYWKTRQEAQNYIDVMQRSDGYSGMKIVEIQFRIVNHV